MYLFPTKDEIDALWRDYVENKGLVAHMNNAGLSIGAMALVLQAIDSECSRVLDEMNKEEC